MPMEVDAHIFRELIEQADQAREQEERMALLKRACEMYGGEFLEPMSGEEWVLQESVRYKQLYVGALSEVCAYLLERQRYEEALAVCSPACEMYPLDEWQCVRMECYVEMERYEEAYQEYEDTVKLLFGELGVRPSEKMMGLLKKIGAHVSGAPASINEIQEGFQKIEEEGAIYCSLPSFRDIYSMMRRIMEREGQSVYLMLCTITDGKGYVQKNKGRLEILAERLYEAIKCSLRRCDSFTRYNAAQFLILLAGTTAEDCGRISGRITRCFAKEHRSWEKYLDCRAASIAAMETGASGLSFMKRV